MAQKIERSPAKNIEGKAPRSFNVTGDPEDEGKAKQAESEVRHVEDVKDKVKEKLD